MSNVMITGSSRGLGASLAKVFARNHYDVILHGRDKDSLSAVRSMILDYNVDCEIIQGDLLLSSTINDLKKVAEKKEIDILINNAGIYLSKPFLETNMEEFRNVIETNFMTTVYVIHALFPIMKERGSGVIININSLAGKNGSDGEAAYCASKHALRGFSSSLQFEATRYGIRVINVYLGAMKTEMTSGRKDNEKFILPDDAADFIFKISEIYPSMRLTEFTLSRTKY